MNGDPMATGVMVLMALFAVPLALLLVGFGAMVLIAHLRNWLTRTKGPELIAPPWRSVEERDRRVVVQGDDPVACAEDDRRAVAALLAADRAYVASKRRAMAGPRVLRHGNADEGSEGTVTVVEVVPAGAAARREADALARQFRLPAKPDRQ
jgi:hypothetical protein